jgi:hypothetical protein
LNKRFKTNLCLKLISICLFTIIRCFCLNFLAKFHNLVATFCFNKVLIWTNKLIIILLKKCWLLIIRFFFIYCKLLYNCTALHGKNNDPVVNILSFNYMSNWFFFIIKQQQKNSLYYCSKEFLSFFQRTSNFKFWTLLKVKEK